MQDHTARKKRSEVVLASHSIPFLDSLPPLEVAAGVRLRVSEQVAARSFCLVLVADVAVGNDPDFCLSLLRQPPLLEWLSAKELAFLDSYQSDEAGCQHYAWGMEAAHVLLWAIGRLPEMAIPLEETELDGIYRSLCAPDPVEIRDFLQSARLRDPAVILNQLDLTYRMHWSARRNPQGKVNLDVVSEWHRALNWLTFYGDAEWDDVTTDT